MVACVGVTLHGQTHRVEAPENVIRSIGVYEWTGDLAKPAAARLVPVSLFIDKEFKDGGTYYSRPIPLALLNGNIYLLEKSGVPQGTVTLDFARHLQSGSATTDGVTDLGWFGYGTFAALPVAKKTPALRASSTVPKIVSSKGGKADDEDERPTLSRNKEDDPAPGAAKGGRGRRGDGEASVTPAGDPAAEDPDRPHMSKPAGSGPAESDASKPVEPDSATKPGASRTDDHTVDPADDTDRPTLRRRDPKQAEADRKTKSGASVSAVAGSLNDDPDRPNMRRGSTAGVGGGPSKQLTGLPEGLHQMVAVSDPVNREPHPFAREFSGPDERAEVLAAMRKIAQRQIGEYARSNGMQAGSLQNSGEQVAKPRPGARAARARVPAPAKAAATTPLSTAPLSNEELTGYMLSYGGLPTFVYTAVSVPAGATPPLPERYLTLVGQKLPSGEVQLALASVTDAAHLDRQPWLRLVDAVDPDAEHRASLLFELRGHSSRQFGLYRILSAKAEQIFATHPTD